MSSRRGVAVVMLATSLMLASCGADTTEEAFLESLPEPTSTQELAGAGGGTVQPIDLAELPSMSTVAVEATVVDVRRSYANTEDGRFPEIDTSAGPDQLRGLYPLTDIQIRIEAVLGDRDGLEGAFKPGDLVVVTIHGGILHTVLQPDEAKALGVLVTPGEKPADVASDPEEASRPPDPKNEVEVFPDEPTPFAIGVAPDENLAEGDRVILFLTQSTKRAFAGADPIDVITVAHPYGVFHQTEEGLWLSDMAPDPEVDATLLARRVEGS